MKDSDARLTCPQAIEEVYDVVQLIQDTQLDRYHVHQPLTNLERRVRDSLWSILNLVGRVDGDTYENLTRLNSVLDYELQRGPLRK